jgi:DNA-binding transcriptional ArsR family regulator
MPDELRLKRVRSVFAVLADQQRLKILLALTAAEELCVGEVADVLGTSMSVASHHLRKLRDCGILEDRSDGKLAYYFLRQRYVASLAVTALGATDAERRAQRSSCCGPSVRGRLRHDKASAQPRRPERDDRTWRTRHVRSPRPSIAVEHRARGDQAEDGVVFVGEPSEFRPRAGLWRSYEPCVRSSAGPDQFPDPAHRFTPLGQRPSSLVARWPRPPTRPPLLVSSVRTSPEIDRSGFFAECPQDAQDGVWVRLVDTQVGPLAMKGFAQAETQVSRLIRGKNRNTNAGEAVVKRPPRRQSAELIASIDGHVQENRGAFGGV